jgi:hypothetical protein
MGKVAHARLAAVAAAAAVLLPLLAVPLETGCVVETVNAPASGVAVSGPPPQPMQETRPPQPSARASWVSGYWHWTGMQYTWIPGHWEDAPPGKQWRAPKYSLRDGTYFYEPGSWSTPAP